MMQQFHYEGYNVLMKAYTTDRSLRIATVWLRQTDRWSSLYAKLLLFIFNLFFAINPIGKLLIS